jgi:D-alanine--poly(phosphoribitol) ligase subunit 1
MYHYCLGNYFSETVEKYNHLPALHCQERDYSYSDIAHWVECLAELLLEKGCGKGDVIAIGHNKNPLSYALMLAGLRLGITYVNIDVASPLERNARILDVCGAKILFYDSQEYKQSMSELAGAHACELLFLNEEELSAPDEKALLQQEYLQSRVDGSCIAYIMFTSGSTGIPKGVAVTHQNALHFIAWGQSRFNVSSRDNFANLSPMYFDNSVFDFYTALFSGASLTPISRDLLTSPYELVPFVGKMQCTIWFSVPTLLIYLKAMKAMTADALSSLRLIVFGGEGYPKAELKKLYDDFSTQAELVNVYGPTECTCICSAHTISEEDFKDFVGLPALGILNQNFDHKILDENDKEAESGELCLIGPNVASGYINDVERTEEVFKTLYDGHRYMKRMYRTGDLVREESGCLYFMGRKDNQIKHMGYRIELEEIEAAVSALPDVVRTAVVYKRLNNAFGKIYCYVKSQNQIDTGQVRSRLAEKLPEYMIPDKIIVLDELPLNPNGKVDRKSLAELPIN